MGSGQFGIVLPLVGFNLGVEIGQLSVEAIVLSNLVAASATSHFRSPMGPSLFSLGRVSRKLLDDREDCAVIKTNANRFAYPPSRRV
jgi:hypothetical protein